MDLAQRWYFQNLRAREMRFTVMILFALRVQSALLIISNQRKTEIKVASPKKEVISPGEHLIIDQGSDPTSFRGWSKGSVRLEIPKYSESLPEGLQRYAVLVVNSSISLHDTNDLQVELSSAAHACLAGGVTAACMAEKAFGGLPESLVEEAFRKLWHTVDYWKICNARPPAEKLRGQVSKAGHRIDILREEPLVASIRDFVSPEGCRELMQNHAGLEGLVLAHVGSGGGATSTSESRETLTNNMFVNWDEMNILTETAAATFDVVSELVGEQVPYEGQEPVNFLHYLKGFEYKPHTDGGGGGTGKRVATTLIYCEAAKQGGGTVFPQGTELNPPLRFQPTPGSLLFFEYAPAPYLQEHAACPVIEGNKSTLTQWHRLGVSPQKPWDNFENWGQYHNPFIHSRWKGARYGADAANTNTREL